MTSQLVCKRKMNLGNSWYLFQLYLVFSMILVRIERPWFRTFQLQYSPNPTLPKAYNHGSSMACASGKLINYMLNMQEKMPKIASYEAFENFKKSLRIIFYFLSWVQFRNTFAKAALSSLKIYYQNLCFLEIKDCQREIFSIGYSKKFLILHVQQFPYYGLWTEK